MSVSCDPPPQKSGWGATSTFFYIQGDTTSKCNAWSFISQILDLGRKKMIVKDNIEKLGEIWLWIVFLIIKSMLSSSTVIIIFGYIGECPWFLVHGTHEWNTVSATLKWFCTHQNTHLHTEYVLNGVCVCVCARARVQTRGGWVAAAAVMEGWHKNT